MSRLILSGAIDVVAAIVCDPETALNAIVQAFPYLKGRTL